MKRTFATRCGDDPQQMEALKRVMTEYHTCQVYDVGDLLATHERDHLVVLGKAVDQAQVAGMLRSMLKFLGPSGTPHVPPQLPADSGGVSCVLPSHSLHVQCRLLRAYYTQTASQRLLLPCPSYLFSHSYPSSHALRCSTHRRRKHPGAKVWPVRGWGRIK